MTEINLSTLATIGAGILACTVLVRLFAPLAVTQKQDGKWRATVTEVLQAPIDKVWTVLSDFNGLQRHYPQSVKSCETIEGEENNVGSVRAASAIFPDVGIVSGQERLLTLDDVNHTTSYALIKIDLGWTGFVAHISCESVDNDQTNVKWSYELNPLRDQTEEEFVKGQSGYYLELLKTVTGIVAK